jgi:hypothetical protein
MKTTNDSLTGTEQGAAPALTLTAPARGAVEAQLDALKTRLVEPVLSGLANSSLGREVAWAATEAAALAWCTVCPVLVLPALLEEKVRNALRRWEREQQIQSARL